MAWFPLAGMAAMEPLPIDDAVLDAFDAFLKADRWTSVLTPEERGRKGARKRELNRVLRRRGLTFDDVAPHVCAMLRERQVNAYGGVAWIC